MARGSEAQPQNANDVQCEYEGKTYRGKYTVTKNTLTVSWLHGSKSSTPGSNPGFLASLLLSELVQDAKRRGVLNV